MNLQTRNEQIFATIHDLPMELLVRVFYAATEFRFSDLTLKEATGMLQTICRVSSHWRSIALSLPELWGRLIDIAGFSSEQLHNFLEWSRPYPIEIFLDGEVGSRLNESEAVAMQNRLSRVLFELDRVSYLVIRRFGLTKDHYERLHGLAPNLVLFSFEGVGAEPVPLPSQPFGIGAPLLQSLHLTSALITFEQVSYPSLRHFSAQDTREPFQPSTRAWLIFFSNHPHLETLKLSYAISVRFTDAFEWLPTVDLEHLREFTLFDDATPCAYLLPKVKIPDACRVSIRAGLDNPGGVRSLQDTFPTFISNRLDDHLQVTLSGTSVSFSNDLRCEQELCSNPKIPYFFFGFQWQLNFEPFEDIPLPQSPFAFLSDSHLVRVNTLRIDLPPIDGRCALEDAALFSAFQDWLGRFSSVHHMIVEMSAIDTVLDLIGECGGSDDEGQEVPSPQIIFPSLEGITVVEGHGEELDWGVFISFAEWRSDIGHKVKYIRVPKEEIDNLGWEDATRIAELDIEINLR